MKRLLIPILTAWYSFIAAYEPKFDPWFPPLFEAVARFDGFHGGQDRFDTAMGSIPRASTINEFGTGLNLTVWPDWNIDIGAAFAGTRQVSFSYENFEMTVRRQLWNDIQGDPLSVVAGLSLFFPPTRFTRITDVWYHGTVNVELVGAVGKEFTCCDEWLSRIAGHMGIGFANRGSPWVRAGTSLDWRLTPQTTFSFLTRFLFGLGDQNINNLEAFDGYASINHQSIDLGLQLKRDIAYWATVLIEGFYNVHARNFPEGYYTVQAGLEIPFSF